MPKLMTDLGEAPLLLFLTDDRAGNEVGVFSAATVAFELALDPGGGSGPPSQTMGPNSGQASPCPLGLIQGGKISKSKNSSNSTNGFADVQMVIISLTVSVKKGLRNDHTYRKIAGALMIMTRCASQGQLA